MDAFILAQAEKVFLVRADKVVCFTLNGRCEKLVVRAIRGAALLLLVRALTITRGLMINMEP